MGLDERDDEYIPFYDISDFVAKSAVISSILYFSDSNAATAEPFRDTGDGEFQYEQSAMSSRNILKQKLGARNLPQSCKDFFKKKVLRIFHLNGCSTRLVN
jgi:hypothetical protein